MFIHRNAGKVSSIMSVFKAIASPIVLRRQATAVCVGAAFAFQLQGSVMNIVTHP